MDENRTDRAGDLRLMLAVLLPFLVYEDCGMITPEGDPLLTLEAGFREKEDAELFANIKAEKSKKKYVIKGSME